MLCASVRISKEIRLACKILLFVGVNTNLGLL